MSTGKYTVTQSKGDPKILKRGPKGDPILSKRGTKRDPNYVKGDPKFDFFRIVHKERICYDGFMNRNI